MNLKSECKCYNSFLPSFLLLCFELYIFLVCIITIEENKIFLIVISLSDNGVLSIPLT